MMPKPIEQIIRKHVGSVGDNDAKLAVLELFARMETDQQYQARMAGNHDLADDLVIQAFTDLVEAFAAAAVQKAVGERDEIIEKNNFAIQENCKLRREIERLEFLINEAFHNRDFGVLLLADPRVIWLADFHREEVAERNKNEAIAAARAAAAKEDEG